MEHSHWCILILKLYRGFKMQLQFRNLVHPPAVTVSEVSVGVTLCRNIWRLLKNIVKCWNECGHSQSFTKHYSFTIKELTYKLKVPLTFVFFYWNTNLDLLFYEGVCKCLSPAADRFMICTVTHCGCTNATEQVCSWLHSGLFWKHLFKLFCQKIKMNSR